MFLTQAVARCKKFCKTVTLNREKMTQGVTLLLCSNKTGKYQERILDTLLYTCDFPRSQDD